jgi:carnitine-CoA ligase
MSVASGARPLATLAGTLPVSESVYRDDSVIPYVLRRHAQQNPQRPCVRFEDGSGWTWAEALRECGQAAAALQAAGVRRGHRVAVLLRNGPEFLRAWWGITQSGAVLVPLHTAARGDQLARMCRDAAVTIVVSAPEFKSALRDASLDSTAIWDLSSFGVAPFPDPPIEPWDVHTINFTSGTTGPAKGAEARWTQTYLAGKDVFGAAAGLTAADRWLVDLPLHHVAAQQITVTALSVGASIALRERFTGSSYWQVARESGATHALLAGSMAALLAQTAPGADDRRHGVRVIVSSPMVADAPAFIRRFGLLDMIAGFGGTETGTPLLGTVSRGLPPGAAGRPRGRMQARIVDSHDIEVPDGQTGELIVRSSTPWEISTSYVGHPEATARAWRNGWFHTGDVFRRDANGWYYFVDRMHDAIRRRGENISSFEVERHVLEHPGVSDAACIGVPTGLGDHDVKIFVVGAGGRSIPPEELIDFLVTRLPYFMVPRYIEQIDELPRTATQKVRKAVLRDMSPSPSCWDREAAGLRVTRNGIERGGG